VIEVTPELSIPESEVRFTTSRSSGPGGQNVNKVETRVTLLFDVTSSTTLSEAQRQRLCEVLRTRITRAGVLRVVAQVHRTQAANQRTAVERFVELVRDALAETPPRVPTSLPRAARRRRLEAKRRQGRLKQQRGRPPVDE
jgi:ribosome-associated protein